MAKPSTQSFDVTGFVDQAASQFRNLNPKEPGQWPPLPKIATWAAACAAVVAAGWFAVLSTANDDLEALRLKEPQLKASYKDRLGQAVNLSEFLKQKRLVQEYVTQLEKQLPGKAEMDALLSDINQAGLGRGLQFELFRPGQIQVKEYYAELPIAIRVSGRYHDVGSFAADVANLSRIVTLQNITITPVGARDASGTLAMDATARTYRYLDATEIASQRKSTKGPGAAK
jgi:type IV pilus assembly protein PilO